MIVLKTDKEIDIMRESGRLAAQLLNLVEEHIQPGITTQELNDICHDYTVKNGAISAPLTIKDFQNPFVHQLTMSCVMESQQLKLSCVTEIL